MTGGAADGGGVATARRKGEAALQALLLRVGIVNYTWTNTESLLIHLIAGLAGVEKDKAVVIFLTLNTTRARLDLVERLAKLPDVDRARRARILDLTGRFQRESSLRNKLNHCIYSLDPADGSLSTILMRVSDRDEQIRFGLKEPADEAQLRAIDATIARLRTLNRDFWKAIRAFGYPV